MSIGFSDKDVGLLRKLNARSWSHSFSPESDVDWNSCTTRDEFRRLYDAWSLFLGTRHEMAFDDDQRTRFARYQQMNLMLATALFERSALGNFESLYGDDDEPEFQEYVAHLVKEETYHYVLFRRACAAILESEPHMRPLPEWPFKAYLAVVLFTLRVVPSRRLRHGMFFYVLRFIEEITLQASVMARRTVDRGDSLVPRVWELHAIDEARHVAFDDLMMRKAVLPGILKNFPRWLAMPMCLGASALLNLNEIWSARQLGINVAYYELPFLMKHCTAPFKRRVFRLLFGGSADPQGASS